MKIPIYNYNGCPFVCKIPFDGNIQLMVVNTDIGDETLIVLYDNGKEEHYRAGTYSGSEAFYEIYNKDTGFDIVHNKEWENSKDTFDRMQIARKLEIEFLNNHSELTEEFSFDKKQEVQDKYNKKMYLTKDEFLKGLLGYNQKYHCALVLLNGLEKYRKYLEEVL